MNIDDILFKLSKSKFRSSFHLKEKDKEYIKDKGMDKIREHAKDFITKRLAPKVINNDGKQTPYKGHPVFISQHATATCCRNCMYKWHHIESTHILTDDEKEILTDAAKIFVLKGEDVALVDGDVTNIKITYPYDLKLANTILNDKND